MLHDIDSFRAATEAPPLTEAQRDGLSRALPSLRDRAKTIPEILEKAHFVLTSRPLEPDDKARAALDDVSRGILTELTPRLQNANWQREDLEAAAKAVAEGRGLGLGKVAQPLRAALAGRTITPSVFDMMLVIGRDETLARIADVTG